MQNQHFDTWSVAYLIISETNIFVPASKIYLIRSNLSYAIFIMH